MPPEERSPQTPWPLWPMQLRTEAAHEEGGIRDWSIATTKFTGDENGNVKQLHAVRVGAPPKFEPIPGTEFTMDADLVLLAMGFLGPVRNGMIEQLGVELDQPRQRCDRRKLHVVSPRSLRGRRHASRTVAGGVGDRRRPQSCGRSRRLPADANAAHCCPFDYLGATNRLVTLTISSCSKLRWSGLQQSSVEK